MIAIILIIVVVYSILLKKIVLKKNLQYEYYRDIPTKDSPAYVGKVIKGYANGNDIIATIIDLHYRGYVEISEENIKGKNKKVLYLQKDIGGVELEEHEMFLLNHIFKSSNRVVFDDYIRSSKFKSDFTAFDKMLDRKIERNTIFKNSKLKNINKIIFLTSFMIFGIAIFYSLLLPITLSIAKSFTTNTKTFIICNGIISAIIFVIIAYKYISYISKSTSAQENINLNITYIILTIILGIGIIMGVSKNVILTLQSELIGYKMLINMVLSLITILYMFNIIKHDEKREYWYYFFIIVSIFSIILNLKIAMCICIIFLTTYMFWKTPKHANLKEEDYIFKWNAFKKYLEDYSMLGEQEENAILIWERYLIYAISLGINKKIVRHYGKLNRISLIDENYMRKFYIEYLE